MMAGSATSTARCMRASARLLVLAAASAALVGCASMADREAAAGSTPLTPLDQYPLTVGHAPDQVALAPHAQGLSPNQQAALSAFVARWRDNGGGMVEVRAPVGAGDPGLARYASDATGAYLQRLGVPAANLRLVGYDAGKTPGAPVIASYLRDAPVVEDCSRGWSNLTSTEANKPYRHFGCVDTANLAAMIANPHDLVAPADIDASDASHRDQVIQHYRQNALTSTPPDPQASGEVSAQ